ncbi:FecR domain-containing protein [bacterium]|nr:FecR domain-containing protein [bacterium]
MKQWTGRIRWFGFVLGLAAATAFIGGEIQRAFSAEVAGGMLRILEGSVEVKRRGEENWVEVKKVVKVGPGDIISTGIDGKALLNFKNSETKIDPLTQFVVGRSIRSDTEIYTELYLLSGKVSSHVTKTRISGIRNRFNVITPTAVVGVRGTIQTVEYSPGMGTNADIKDGKGFAAPLPVDQLPPGVLELLGITKSDTGTKRDTDQTQTKKAGR